MSDSIFHPQLQKTVDSLLAGMAKLSTEREELLRPLTDFIVERVQAERPVHLNYICTHNSRRSHLGQIWAAVAAAHFEIPHVTTFSGGTEATAFNPRAVAAIERDGFIVTKTEGNNPHYSLSLGPTLPRLTCFSKTYDDPHNASDDFAAVMTCNHADAHCPAVLGSARISLPYEDPKAADDTPEEAARYTERSAQIGTELLAAFGNAQARLVSLSNNG